MCSLAWEQRFQIMIDPGRVELNIRDLKRELDAFKRVRQILGEEGNRRINDWIESVRNREHELDKLQKEFSEKRKKLDPDDLSGMGELNKEVINHVKDVIVMKERAVEIFLLFLTREKLIQYSEEQITKFISDSPKEEGSGGFGMVYKGYNGVEVAVKVFKQKVTAEEIFINEVSFVLKASHPNIIKLHGYCFVKNLGLRALVYEYMSNKSLDKVLLLKHPKVEWQKLYVIAIETAKALAYLHHACGKPIIHFDVKPANVLVHGDFSAKLGDFGTAKIMNVPYFISTETLGSAGYTAPEMIIRGSKVTSKCDVYSFGMMLFYILNMHNNTKSQRLFSKDVWGKLQKKGELDEAIKECGIPEKDRGKAKLLSIVAFWCVQFNPSIRPSMETVACTLEKEKPVAMPPDPKYQWDDNFSMLKSQDMNNSSVIPSIISSMPENTSRERQWKESVPVLPRCTPRRFSHEEISTVTSKFSTKVNYDDDDEFGDVYKGELSNGVQVIVKVLAETEGSEEIFVAEVSTMAETCHANLIKLYGYCFDENMKALVYEYIESTSLMKILNGSCRSLKWEKLYDIAIEIAKVISYLHDSLHKRIVHCDINATNVLLNLNDSPKLKSFELAKLLNKNENQLNLTRFRGTRGYTAPEIWKQASQVTSKCDVYSFGIMLFEILGMRSINLYETWFPRQVWNKFKIGQLDGLLAECGISENDREKANVLSMVALWCVQHTPTIRPTMKSVVNILENEIQVTTPPNPFFPSNLGSLMQPSREAVYSVFSPNIDERVLENKLREWLANPIQKCEFSLGPLRDIRTTENFGKESIEMLLAELPTYTLKQFSSEEITKMLHSSVCVASNDFVDFFSYRFPDKKEVLINVLKITDVKEEVFINEMRLMGNIDHPNLAKFEGYCFDASMIAFVHEYGGLGDSLDELLNEDVQDEKLYGNKLWEMLYDMVIETAKGISYLHNDSPEQIVIYAVNPANVFQVRNHTKFRFFRWEKLFGETGQHFGYVAPEIGIPGQHVTWKSDVFSFGIMLFEVLGKLRNDGDRYCSPRVFWEIYENRGVEEIMKEFGIIRKNREKASILCMVGFWCIQYTPEIRPSMNTVLNILENEIQVIAPPNPFIPSMQASPTSMKPSRANGFSFDYGKKEDGSWGRLGEKKV